MRLDQYLFQNGFTESREKARSLIMAGIVYVNGDKADKAGTNIKEDATIDIRGETHPYVSRGGLKLEKAIRVFDIPVTGKICMDIGASTGGFTDCLLQNGAAKVYAIDVGYGQFAWKLRCDERVVVLERTNIRKLDPAVIQDDIQLFTIDVSFISLGIVIPSLYPYVKAGCKGLCLVKPQFEAGKEKVGKKGVVRSAETHIEVLCNAANIANNCGYSILGVDYSPIRGPEGNIEFLLYIEKCSTPLQLTVEEIKETVEKAHETTGRIDECMSI